ncbi:Uncharacterised protein [Mycobacteroides abscessus subsp. abscessus]|nr:Uncharacterised protein [Mycobacteroides abscessus subsp. abscessus]
MGFYSCFSVSCRKIAVCCRTEESAEIFCKFVKLCPGCFGSFFISFKLCCCNFALGINVVSLPNFFKLLCTSFTVNAAYGRLEVCSVGIFCPSDEIIIL